MQRSETELSINNRKENITIYVYTCKNDTYYANSIPAASIPSINILASEVPQSSNKLLSFDRNNPILYVCYYSIKVTLKTVILSSSCSTV